VPLDRDGRGCSSLTALAVTALVVGLFRQDQRGGSRQGGGWRPTAAVDREDEGQDFTGSVWRR
jgi:hypothetical protein